MTIKPYQDGDEPIIQEDDDHKSEDDKFVQRLSTRCHCLCKPCNGAAGGGFCEMIQGEPDKYVDQFQPEDHDE